MAVEYRPITDDEVEDFRRLMGLAFGFEPDDKDADHFRSIVELDRTIGAFDGAEMVGTSGTYSLTMTIPGDRAPCGGLTMVAVKPTHRRRGVLTGMLREQFADTIGRGEALGSLWASESSIYGRFGYGLAGHRLEIEVPTRYGELEQSWDVPGTVRLVDAATALPRMVSVYEAAAVLRPGMLARSEEWWRTRRLHDPEHWREGYTARRYAVYEVDGTPQGYATYRVKEKWEEGHGHGELLVIELVAVTTHGAAALWRFLLGHDLIGTVKAWNRPVDDSLPWLLAQSRRAKRTVSDALWVRVFDVPAALSGRRYSAPGELVLEVEDRFLPSVAGRFRLIAGPDGTATCVPTDAPADLVLDVRELGAAYLGGTGLRMLSRAGLVSGSAGAVGRADRMFRWDPAPWCVEVF